MDRRFLGVMAVSLLLALVISALFYQMLAQRSRSMRPVHTDMCNLVVAARALPVGIALNPADLRTTQVPVDQFPAGCFTRIDEILDRPVASSILADEPVREARLAPRGSGLGLAPVIPPGMRAVSVRVNEVVGVAGFVIPAMHVDVLVTGHLPRDDGPVTKTILQDILVISAGQTIEPDSRGKAINAPVVTLLVKPAQAEALTLASDWRIQLVLRNGADRAIERTPGSQFGTLFGRAEAPIRAEAAASRRVAAKLPSAPLVQQAPRTTEEIVVIRGTQKTIEQVGARM